MDFWPTFTESIMLKNLFSPILCAALMLSAPVLNADQILAPGYGKLGYTLPAAGSFDLPALGVAADGDIIDASGRERSLHDLFGGKYVLLSFIYSRCDDVNGCPLSTHVLYQIKSAMKQQPQLAKKLKLVSLSFDPEYDTPQVLKLYANNFKYAGNAGEWDFVSTRSLEQLQPILQAYGQQVQRQFSLNGASGKFSHVLRVFLIDPALKIRNIYSVAFLHQDVLLNDVQTLLMQENTPSEAQPEAAINQSLARPGDDKSGYESASYTTHSQALVQRKGQAIDLLQLAQQPPLGLPQLPPEQLKSLTREKIALGRKLFYDRRLSLNNTFSCAMCHIPEQGFTSNELEQAVGIEGRSVRRNSPTIFNVGYARVLFHDGRENTLEQQIWGPLLAKSEMGNPSVGQVIGKIKKLVDYRKLFENAFGVEVNMLNLGQALASYERTLLSADSPFDRWFYAMDNQALSASARRGFTLFNGKAGCSGCHLIGESSALLMDDQLHNTGVGYARSMGVSQKHQRVQLAPGVFAEIDNKLIASLGAKEAADVGQYEITENPADRWKYKTPTLRNVALTAPYMHDGSLQTLQQVVEFYNRGAVQNPLLDARIRPLGLNSQQQKDLVNFLQSLTGSNVQALVKDGFAAPIGDTLEASSRTLSR
jgi:cytochrome c peroxidase